jgi:hypothetical protein
LGYQKRFHTAWTQCGSRPEEWRVSSCPIPAVHPVPDIRRSTGGSDASRVDTSVRGDVVDLAARSTDIH